MFSRPCSPKMKTLVPLFTDPNLAVGGRGLYISQLLSADFGILHTSIEYHNKTYNRWMD